MLANKTPWLGLCVISLILGGATGGFSAYLLLKEPIHRLNQLSPLVVLDRAQFIQTLSPNATSEQMAKAVADWKHLGSQLTQAGYVVLDSTAIVSAPEDVYVRPEATSK
jgi:hypothetical protein